MYMVTKTVVYLAANACETISKKEFPTKRNCTDWIRNDVGQRLFDKKESALCPIDKTKALVAIPDDTGTVITMYSIMTI